MEDGEIADFGGKIVEIDADGQSPPSDGNNYEEGDIVLLKEDCLTSVPQDSEDDCYFMPIEFYSLKATPSGGTSPGGNSPEEPEKDGDAALVRFCVARKGSDFGPDGTRMLCWYNKADGTIVPFEGSAPSQKEGDDWVIAAKPGGLRTGRLAQATGTKTRSYTNNDGATVGGDDYRAYEEYEKERFPDKQSDPEFNVGYYAGNVTRTANTYYLPTISDTSQIALERLAYIEMIRRESDSAAQARIVVNTYLGNNGRLCVSDTSLLLTKHMVPFAVDANREFHFQVYIKGYSGPHDAIVVKRYENGTEDGSWHKQLHYIDLQLNEKLFLKNEDGSLATVEREGKKYYVFIGTNNPGEETGSSDFVMRLYHNEEAHEGGSGDNDTDTPNIRVKTDAEDPDRQTFYAEKVWLFTKDQYENFKAVNGNYEDSDGSPAGDDSDYREKNDFELLMLDMTPEPGSQVSPTDISIESLYMTQSAYRTKSVDFGLKDNTANYFGKVKKNYDKTYIANVCLKSDEGLLFDGIKSGSEYAVIEYLTKVDQNDSCDFKYLLHVSQGGKQHNYLKTEQPKPTLFNETSNPHIYGVTGTTDNYEQAAHYGNTVGSGLMLTKTVTGELGDKDKYWTFYIEISTSSNASQVGPCYAELWENEDENKRPATDAEIRDFIEEQKLENEDAGYIIWEEVRGTLRVNFKNSSEVAHPPAATPPNAFDWERSVITRVRLKHGQTLKIFGLPVGALYRVAEVEANKEGYKTSDKNISGMIGPDITMAEVEFTNHKNPKDEISPGEGEVVGVGDEITYEITWDNYEDQAADVVITDKLDPGVDFVSASFEDYTLTLDDPPKEEAAADLRISMPEEAAGESVRFRLRLETADGDPLTGPYDMEIQSVAETVNGPDGAGSSKDGVTGGFGAAVRGVVRHIAEFFAKEKPVSPETGSEEKDTANRVDGTAPETAENPEDAREAEKAETPRAVRYGKWTAENDEISMEPGTTVIVKGLPIGTRYTLLHDGAKVMEGKADADGKEASFNVLLENTLREPASGNVSAGTEGRSPEKETTGTASPEDSTVESESSEDSIVESESQEEMPAESAFPEGPTESETQEETSESESGKEPTGSESLEESTESVSPDGPEESVSPQEPTESLSPQEPTESAPVQESTESMFPEGPTESNSPEELTESAPMQAPAESVSPQGPPESVSPWESAESASPQEPTESGFWEDTGKSLTEAAATEGSVTAKARPVSGSAPVLRYMAAEKNMAMRMTGTMVSSPEEIAAGRSGAAEVPAERLAETSAETSAKTQNSESAAETVPVPGTLPGGDVKIGIGTAPGTGTGADTGKGTVNPPTATDANAGTETGSSVTMQEGVEKVEKEVLELTLTVSSILSDVTSTGQDAASQIDLPAGEGDGSPAPEERNKLTVKDDNGKPEITIEYDETSHTVIWTLKNRPAGDSGRVRLVVRVNENADKFWSYDNPEAEPSEKENDYMVRNKASIKVGDNPEQDTNVVENPTKCGLIVTKTVTGDGNTEREWHFRVELSDKTISGTYGDMTFTNGAAEFTLKHGESRTATGLPPGITYTVTESEANQDGYTSSSTGATGTIPDGMAEAEFVNSRYETETPPETPHETEPHTPHETPYETPPETSPETWPETARETVQETLPAESENVPALKRLPDEEAPYTGDSHHPFFWLAVMALAMAAAGFSIWQIRKIAQSEKRPGRSRKRRRRMGRRKETDFHG